jgi:hypothetical protein
MRSPTRQEPDVIAAEASNERANAEAEAKLFRAIESIAEVVAEGARGEIALSSPEIALEQLQQLAEHVDEIWEDAIARNLATQKP